MDGILNSKLDKQTIYDIYRACRLCGAGAGYKMPIIQNVVDLDSNGIELKDKIRNCVQIEVHSDDKMPPLICELCVDKVNDFHEFMEMCQTTNKRTRQRLGLPAHSSGKVRNNKYDSGDCILGVTERVYTNDDSDEPLSGRRAKPEPRVVVKVEKIDKGYRETNSKEKVRRDRESRARQDREKTRSKDNRPSRTTRASSGSACSSPPRATRQTRANRDDDVCLSSLKQESKKPTITAPPKSILKKDHKKSEDSSRTKRSRDLPAKPDVPQKKVKLAPPPPSPAHTCRICGRAHVTAHGLASHMRTHTVNYTNVRLACNACQMWFLNPDEALAHHNDHKTRHRPYRCRRCQKRPYTYKAYQDHIENGECLPWDEVPDVKCDLCWKTFVTNTLMGQHKCGGIDSRPGGKCLKCKRNFALLKNLRKHEETCTYMRKSATATDKLLSRCWPARVKLVRCDSLLANQRDGHFDVSNVPQGFDLDPRSTYPYRRAPMVCIKTELADLDESGDDARHWDSDSGDGERRTVDSLTTLSLKTIFSNKFLGKVPRKRRRTHPDKNAFAMIGDDFDDLRSGIDNIIDNLGNDDDDDDNASVNSESLLCNDVDERNDVSNDVSKDFNDSQTLLVNEGENECSSGKVVVDNDKDLSTDCETDAEGDVNEDKLDGNRLSNSSNDKECTNTENNLNKSDEFNESLNNSGLSHKDTLDDVSSKDNCESSKNQDETANGEIIASPKANSVELKDTVENKSERKDSDKFIAENDEQIMESQDNLEENSQANIIEKDKTSAENDSTNNTILAENNDKDESVTNENSQNDEHTKNNNESQEESLENHEKPSDKNDEDKLNTQQVNEAICNDIENKINDLIALRNNTVNNDWQDNVGNLENNENSASYKNTTDDNDWSENNDNNHAENKNKDTRVAENDDDDWPVSNDNDWSENNSVNGNENENNDTGVTENANNDWSENNGVNNTENENNDDNEKDKISLEDLLSPKDPDVKSMDLDSISDEEFNFDA